MQECWVREAAEEEGWNQLEGCQPTIPPVRVSEVSGGERREIPGGASGPPLLLIQPLVVGEPSGPKPWNSAR